MPGSTGGAIAGRDALTGLVPREMRHTFASLLSSNEYWLDNALHGNLGTSITTSVIRLRTGASPSGF